MQCGFDKIITHNHFELDFKVIRWKERRNNKYDNTSRTNKCTQTVIMWDGGMMWNEILYTIWITIRIQANTVADLHYLRPEYLESNPNDVCCFRKQSDSVYTVQSELTLLTNLFCHLAVCFAAVGWCGDAQNPLCFARTLQKITFYFACSR